MRTPKIVPPAKKKSTKPYVIIRTTSAGCFAGYLQSRKGRECALLESRRLWYWAGASSLSELAVLGTSKPDACKFPVAIPEPHILTEVVEVIPVTALARTSIQGVKPWTQH